MLEFIMNIDKTNVLILLAMLPSIIIGFIIYKKDIIEKEPPLLLIKLFLFGALSSGIALLLEIYFEKFLNFTTKFNILNIILSSFIIIGFVEEITKWFFTYVISWKCKEFNYTYDAIVYAVFVSLGFATIENIIAILSLNGNVLLAVQRGIITVPAHAFFGILSGYYLGKSKKYKNRGWYKKSRTYLILSIILPILVHGLFDGLILLLDKVFFLILLFFIIYLYYSSYVKVVKSSKEVKKITR